MVTVGFVGVWSARREGALRRRKPTNRAPGSRILETSVTMCRDCMCEVTMCLPACESGAAGRPPCAIWIFVCKIKRYLQSGSLSVNLVLANDEARTRGDVCWLGISQHTLALVMTDVHILLYSFTARSSFLRCVGGASASALAAFTVLCSGSTLEHDSQCAPASDSSSLRLCACTRALARLLPRCHLFRKLWPSSFGRVAGRSSSGGRNQKNIGVGAANSGRSLDGVSGGESWSTP